MTKDQLVALRDRLYLHDEIPEDSIHADDPPYYIPPEDSVEYQYMMERRRALGGSIPRRTTKARRPLELPTDKPFAELRSGSGTKEVSHDDGLHPPAAQPGPRRAHRRRASCRSSPTRPARSAWTRCSAS